MMIAPLLSVLRRAQRSERNAHLVAEDFRLFPGGEVAAFVELVVMNEFGERPLGPAARRLIDLSGKALTATGMVTLRTSKKPPLYCQYRRAEDTAVLVNQ